MNQYTIKTVASLYLKCAISQIMKSQSNIRNDLRYKANQDLISISKKISSDILVM